jgi:DNA-binding GntR family transcriptional regulator
VVHKHRAKYQSKASRLGERIVAEIAGGGYKAGALLPPETRLCETYRASRVTIRRTLDQLAERGLVERIPHRGVVVRSGPAGQFAASPRPCW